MRFEFAQELRALVLFVEHRYYGASLPFGNASQTPVGLRFLTIEQALADYAGVIHDLRARLHAPRAKVIALGGSYGGMLAAWLRMHYPSAVVGAIAASAPVLAFDGLR